MRFVLSKHVVTLLYVRACVIVFSPLSRNCYILKQHAQTRPSRAPVIDLNAMTMLQLQMSDIKQLIINEVINWVVCLGQVSSNPVRG